MLKHILALITLSIIVILFLPQFAVCLHYIGQFHSWVAELLLNVFSSSEVGRLITRVLALLLIPLIIALFPAFLFWVARRREMPHLATVTWILWVMLATIIALR